MYENKICCDYRDGKVTKEQLDKCSTCDFGAVVHDGLSEESRKNKEKISVGKDECDEQYTDEMS